MAYFHHPGVCLHVKNVYKAGKPSGCWQQKRRKIKIQIDMDIGQWNGIQALIFDVDGTLADSMPAHLAAWQEAARKYNFPFTPDDHLRYAGKADQAIVGEINREHQLNLSAREVAKAKETAFLQHLHQVQPIIPITTLVKKFYGHKPVAAGTGGFRHIAGQVLKHIGLHAYLDVLVTADDVENYKPAPDTFLLCAQKMGIEPEACLVFEDAELGFEAAANAGMHVIDVRPFV